MDLNRQPSESYSRALLTEPSWRPRASYRSRYSCYGYHRDFKHCCAQHCRQLSWFSLEAMMKLGLNRWGSASICTDSLPWVRMPPPLLAFGLPRANAPEFTKVVNETIKEKSKTSFLLRFAKFSILIPLRILFCLSEKFKCLK
ncbi:hypothetical protein PoB_007424700 [Plakobranchus ocellatus]|uniref:Uncharacterized protein n=1 Tax=Plakobranchus ocellatus TaxID=259542 RepID=A0AAV4DTR3_9GAST|nr:hypothetical protein PoB_007424700 [Plakobranchus ocellatus]